MIVLGALILAFVDLQFAMIWAAAGLISTLEMMYLKPCHVCGYFKHVRCAHRAA